MNNADSIAEVERRGWALNVPIDAPMAEYLSLPAVSAGGLKKMRRSPGHLLADWAAEDRKQTDDTIFGNALHSLILEPELFCLEWVAGPQGAWNRNPMKAEVAALVEEGHPRAKILKPAVYSRVTAAAHAVGAHPYAAELFSTPGHTEKIFLWIDEETGLLCKIRPDHVPLGLRCCVDLKKVLDAREAAFSRTMYQRDYHWSGWFYREGLRAAGIETDEYVFVAVEDEAPHGVMVLPLDSQAEEYGTNQCRKQLGRWAECDASGVWPVYPTEPTTTTLPGYAWRQIEEELES